MVNKADQTRQVLEQLDPSIPFKSRPDALVEPAPQPRRATPPTRPPRAQSKLPPEHDPFDAAKERFRVNLFELLHWQVPTDLAGETTRSERASRYLVFDKYFSLVMTGELESLGLPRLDGEAQAMYLWFYWKSFGYGYQVCAMGHAELIARLNWARNRVRKVLKQLLESTIVEALPEFPPFRNHRPQVYRVYLPRELLAQRLKALRHEQRRESAREGIAKLRQLLDGDAQGNELLTIISPTEMP
jgi:hypothetical protein